MPYTYNDSGDLTAWITVVDSGDFCPQSNVVYELGAKETVASFGKGVKDMKGLFHVVVVDYKAGKVLTDQRVIAESAERAKIKAVALLAHRIDDLDIICNRLGDVREGGAEK